MNRFALERSLARKGYEYIVGCDEVGRGALAGPVVAAAVVFDKPAKASWWNKIDDSKKLSPVVREELSKYIVDHAIGVGIGEVWPKVIDEINIHDSSMRAMRNAVRLSLFNLVGETAILVDGKFLVPTFDCYQEAIVAGDSKIHSIAAASIVAKVYRDNLMAAMESEYPEYEFAKHKGYATVSHRSALKKHGLSPVHRVSFCGNI